MNTVAPASPAISDADRQSLSVLYQVTAADIVFFKQQQWLVMNYAIGLDAALVVIALQLLKGPLTVLAAWLLVVLTCAVPAVALLALKRLRNSTCARRKRLDQTRALLGAAFLQAWYVQKEDDDFYFLFIGVLSASWLVTLWLVWPRA